MPLSYLAARERAHQQYDAASHLLKVTMPLVKDPKLFIGILHTLFNSLEASMDAILAYDRELQLIPPFADTFAAKFNAFQQKAVRRYNLPPEYPTLLLDLKETIDLHKKSPMEFQRGSRLVICQQDYQMKAFSAQDINIYLTKTGRFLALMEEIIRFK